MELTPDLQEKKIFLIEGLKRTYKDQYDAIQPLPYIKDRLYCVDKVFVEGGVEVCLAPELTRGTGGSWERLESYKSIYTDLRFKSKRRVLQGEPGYGKSTLTLQLVYDWCNDVSDSPINNVEILILLRLRQLGSVKSLYRAIKSFLLFNEPRVSKHEIEEIIHNCSSVHIILDGYDEYPGRDSNDNDDVHRIIKMELFAEFDVSLTTRYLPAILREETKRAKLTGFDDKARDEYIRKAVVGNNDEAVEKINQRLYENAIIADLCQVPLIFVMFAHMAHDQRDFMKFKSVTQFFKHILRCFYDHLKQKFKDNRSNDIYLHAMKHHELDKIALEGLNKKNQQLSWIKTEFRQRVGHESYDQYILIGILVEEDVVSDDSTGDNVLFTTMVRFYHKLFCEWYAAHHLVTLVKNAYDINETLRFLDPVDLQYLFRFACGLDPDAGKKLINHLKRLPGGETFAILCILEQTGGVNDSMDSVKDLCSRDVKIKRGDSALLQRSTTQLLEIASNNDIPISCLHLEYSSIKFEGDTIILHNGISLPILPTVEKVHIAGSNAETLTEKDILNLFRYGIKCRRIKELVIFRFDKLQLPISISPEAITNIMKTRNIQVRWRPFDIDFHLDLQIGHWEVDDIQVILNKNPGPVSLSERNNILQDMSTLQLLEVARNHGIPISCLHLEYSSIKFEGDTIMLHSGISLPILPNVEKIHIDGSNTRYGNTGTLTDNDLLNLFQYGMKCGRVKELMFDQFQLSTFSSSEAFKYIMKTKKIQVVRWRPFDIEFHLDQQNGHWEVDDIQVILNENSGTVSLSESNVLQHTSTLQLLEVARNHDIPISCLHFKYSSIKFEGDTIILHSGIPLPILPTVEKILIDASNEQYANTGTLREKHDLNMYHYSNLYQRQLDEQYSSMDLFTEKENFDSLSDGNKYIGEHNALLVNPETLTHFDILSMFRYGMKCGRVKELMFDQLQLPTSFPTGAFTDIMKTKNIQVSWRPFDIDFHLDEQNGHWEVDDIKGILNKNSGTVSISERNSILQDVSTLQLLEVAHNHDIPVSCLHLEYSSIKFEGDTIILHSGIPLPILPTVEKIHIAGSNTRYGNTGTLTDSDMLNLFQYGMKCGRVKELMFEDCLLPLTFSSESIPAEMQSRDIKVSWRSYGYSLNLQSGAWKVDDVDTVRKLCTGILKIRPDDSELLQRCTIKLLENASYHDIPISCLYLDKSFSKIDAGDVILHSGLRLSCPVSVKKVVIDTEAGREMTETEVVDILMFVLQSHMLKELWFDGCLLPPIFSSGSIPAELKSRDIKVLWNNYGYKLNLQSGFWEVDDVDKVRKLCTGKLEIRPDDTEYLQRCTIKLLENASYNDIPISCLYLNESYSKIDAGYIILHSGLRLSCPVSVNKVVISTMNEGRELAETEVVDILMFVQQSHLLKELEFVKLQLPTSVSPEVFTDIMKTRNIQVRWRPFDIDFHLDLQNGHWEVDDIQVIINKTSGTVSLSERNNILQDMSTLQLLEVARNHDIPVSILHLEYSSIKFEGDTIILHSGIPLPILPTVENIHIDASNIEHDNTESLSRSKYDTKRTLTTMDVMNLFHYGMKCGRVKELMFNQFQLPTSVSPEAFTDKMKTQKIQVRWLPFDIHFHLDLETGHWEVDNNDTLRQLCSDTVYIKKSDGILKQTSTIILIHIASSHKIPISCLHLEYSSIKFEGDTIILHSGIPLPILPTLEKIHIAGSNAKDDNTETLPGISYGNQYRRHETLTEKNILKLFCYGMKCGRIKELMFCQLQLPTSVTPETFTNIMRTLNIRIRWRPFDIDFHLDLQNGHWEVDDIHVILNENCRTVSLNENNSILQDTSTLQLLEVARNHDIPVSILHLEYSSMKFEGDTIILHSGIPLPILPTVKKIHIDASNIECDSTESLSRSSRYQRHGNEQYGIKRILTKMDVLNWFHYGMKCLRVKELMFDQFQLPTSFSPEAFTDIMKTQKIQVRWRPFDIEFHLDEQNGHWEVDNTDTLRQLCSDTIHIRNSDDTFKQISTIMFINIASSHEIPISRLCLYQSFSKIDAGYIILHSGLHLSCPVSVEKVVINTETGREMTETEVVDILIFVQQSHKLQKLEFWWCLLPQSIPAESIPSMLKSRNFKVSWGLRYHLNLQSGRWMHCLGTKPEITDTEYNTLVRDFRTRWGHTEW